MTFQVTTRDGSTKARAGTITVRGRTIETPVFMPIGSAGAVKGLTFPQLAEAGAQIVLANAYHLYLRPGMEIIRSLGGLHGFTGWPGAILADSGGYQVYSMRKVRKLTEDGVHFRSFIDGSSHFFTPETVVDIQLALSPDIAMILDDCTPYPVDRGRAEKSTELTLSWARRAREYRRSIPPKENSPTFFGIVQGSTYPDLRRTCAERLIELDFDGYAIGGLSVGEPKEAMREALAVVLPLLPEDKPKYLMGVGTPEDIVMAVELGVDMFDCVLPTRNGRNGTAFTSRGEIAVKAARYKNDPAPLDGDCACFVCRTHSRAYLRHLFNVGHMTGCTLVSYHNVWFYLRLMESLRRAIGENTLARYRDGFLAAYRSGGAEARTEAKEEKWSTGS